jgi:hypothetical protein
VVRCQDLRCRGRVRRGRGKKLREAFRDRLRREGLHGHQDWLEEIAEAYPDEDWVVKAAYPEGRFDFDHEPWHPLYWEAWEALRFDRQYGAMGGEMPIPYTALRAYATDNGIAGDDFRLFHTFMGVIDAEWLKHVADRSKKRKEDEHG